MALLALTLWTVVPLAWVWLASQANASTQPGMGPYLLIIAGVPLTVAVLGKLLAVLSRAHARVAGSDSSPGQRPRTAWLRSMRGERDSGVTVGPLEAILISTFVLAACLAGFWFFFLAGSPLPH